VIKVNHQHLFVHEFKQIIKIVNLFELKITKILSTQPKNIDKICVKSVNDLVDCAEKQLVKNVDKELTELLDQLLLHRHHIEPFSRYYTIGTHHNSLSSLTFISMYSVFTLMQLSVLFVSLYTFLLVIFFHKNNLFIRKVSED
jgi:hypothetical protein